MKALDILPDKLKQQDGGALIMALMLMAILSIIGISVTNTSITELQITANVQSSNMAYYDADSGVEYTLARIRAELSNGMAILAMRDGNQLLDIPMHDSDPSITGFSFRISAPATTASNDPNWNDSKGRFYFISNASGPGGTQNSIAATFNVSIHPAFGLGIVTDGNLRINGAPNIGCSDQLTWADDQCTMLMHANGNVLQVGAGVVDGDVSAHHDVNINSAVSGEITENAAYQPIPPITTEFMDDLRTDTRTIYNSGDIVLNLAYFTNLFPPSIYPTMWIDGNTIDLGNRIIFADGLLTLHGSMNIVNGTLAADGDVDIQGASQLNDAGNVGTAIITTGNIEFNGSSTSYGVFWSNGSFRQNGSSLVVGSIVSTGDIDRNGAFNFQFYDQIDNDELPVTSVTNVTRAELRLLRLEDPQG